MVERLLREPCYRLGDDAFLHMFKKDNFPQSLGDSGQDILLHLTGGVSAEAGVDMVIAKKIER
jgi:hypothetical protein